ncbi:MAG: ATP-binding protein [Coleofasciculaceae cyanobacterium]
MQEHPIRILLVEDDSQDVSLLLALLAKAKGFPVEIKHFDNLEKAIDYLREEKVDVVISDLFLPDSKGLETYNQLASQFPDMPIIILSGLEDEAVAISAVQAGAQDYLVKGEFRRQLLVRTIRYSIERQQLRFKMQRQHEILQESEAQLHTIITNNTDGIVVLNQEGTILFANPAATSLLSYQAEELQKQTLNIPLDQESFEKDITRQSGESFVAEVRLVEINWQEQKAYLALLRDITLRKKEEESICKALEQEKQLNQMKSRIISTLSHEYRTPLTTILSSAELLERYRHKFDESKQTKHFERIKTAVEHMTHLVDDVLFVNKAELNKLEFRPEAVDLFCFTQELVSQMQEGTGKQHRLILTTKGERELFFGDPKLLKQLLTNLLSNAIKYSPQGKVISVSLDFTETEVIIQVQDQGIGIPQEEQDKLFQSFSRASNVGTIPGTGLGLVIIKNCVERHGGKISFKSTSDLGTTFTVNLPHQLRETSKMKVDNKCIACNDNKETVSRLECSHL